MDYDLILSTYNPFYKVVFCSLPDRVIVGNSDFDQMTRFSRNNQWILKCEINEAPRRKLRGIKAKFAEANPPSLARPCPVLR